MRRRVGFLAWCFAILFLAACSRSEPPRADALPGDPGDSGVSAGDADGSPDLASDVGVDAGDTGLDTGHARVDTGLAPGTCNTPSDCENPNFSVCNPVTWECVEQRCRYRCPPCTHDCGCQYNETCSGGVCQMGRTRCCPYQGSCALEDTFCYAWDGGMVQCHADLIDAGMPD